MSRIFLFLFVFLLILLLGTPINPLFAVDYKAGDLDGDGRITPADLKILTKDLNTQVAAFRGDINGDNRVDNSDVTAMARLLLSHSNLKKEEITEELIQSFVRDVAADNRIINTGTTGTSTNTRWLEDGKSTTSSTGGTTIGGGTSYQDIIRSVEENQEELGVEVLSDPPTSNDGTTDSGGRAVAAKPGPLRSIFNRISEEGFKNPEEEVLGIPPQFPTEISDYFRKLNQATPAEKLDRTSATLNIDTINSRRKSGGLSLGSSPVDDFLLKAAGTSITSIALGEPEDALVYNNLGIGSVGGIQQRHREQNSRLTSINSLGGERELLPKTPLEIILDPKNPEAIELFDTRHRTNFNLEEEYKTVSVWDQSDDSTAISGDIRNNSDDPIASQAINDMMNNTHFREQANINRDATTTRGEMMRLLFNPSTALLAATGGMSRIGIADGSVIADNYIEIFEDQKDSLIRSGVITQQTADEIEQVYNQVKNAQAGIGAGNSDGGSDFFTMLDGLDAMSGGAVGGVTGGATGVPTGAGTSGGSSTSSVPIPTPRPDDLGSTASTSGGISGTIGAIAGGIAAAPLGIAGISAGSALGRSAGQAIGNWLSPPLPPVPPLP